MLISQGILSLYFAVFPHQCSYQVADQKVQKVDGYVFSHHFRTFTGQYIHFQGRFDDININRHMPGFQVWGDDVCPGGLFYIQSRGNDSPTFVFDSTDRSSAGICS